MVRKWGECSIEVAGSCAGCLICRNSSAGLVASGQPFCSHLTLIYPSGTAVPFPDDCGDCSLWVNSFWGCSTSAVTLTGVWALSFFGRLPMGLKGTQGKVNSCKQGAVNKRCRGV